jgi:hypothetical protein
MCVDRSLRDLLHELASGFSENFVDGFTKYLRDLRAASSTDRVGVTFN